MESKGNSLDQPKLERSNSLKSIKLVTPEIKKRNRNSKGLKKKKTNRNSKPSKKRKRNRNSKPSKKNESK
jgi:hypothetical protein